MSERFFNLFSFNAPAWSLFWEYIANIVYALLLSRLRRRYLAILLVPAAAAICFVIYKEGNLLGGWSVPTFWDGFIRVSWSFLAGMFIYRSGWILRNRLGFLPVAALLMVAFLFPFSKYNLISESIIVLLYFPLMIALGAGTTPASWTRKLCIFSGKISYPLYMTHYWVIWIFGNYYTTDHPSQPRLIFIVLAALAFQLLLAYAVMVLFDIPIRRKLGYLNRTTARSERSG
jgi:peptidoglycan/LPS O-acetylase OafA/YrhL